MSLSGNLGFVPIDEVLRLLTRSKQQGSVDVSGNGLRGRVFVGKGGIDLATTTGDADLHRHLLNSGFADENALRRINSGETTLAAIAEANLEIVELLREMAVESLYQIAHRGEDFEVQEGVTTPYASPKSFELESLLEDARARERDWEKVSEVIPDLTGAISFRRDLGEREEVTVKVDDWKVLSEIGTGSSVNEIADSLGTTEFWTARVAARLVKNDLVVISGQVGSAQPSHGSDDANDEWQPVETFEEEPVAEATAEYDHEPEHAGDRDDSADEYEFADVDTVETNQTEHVSTADDDEDLDPDESWWEEPKDETPATDDEPTTPEVVAEGLSEIPTVDGDAADVEGDTEAFLEKVFSELESSEPEAEEGHGLLRRRRMGTLRDFSSDS